MDRFNECTYSEPEFAVDTRAKLCSLLHSVGGRIASQLAGDVREGNDIAIAQAAVDPATYGYTDSELQRFYRDWFATNLLRKSPLLDTGIDRRQVALESFQASEAHCALINESGGFLSTCDTSRLSPSAVLHLAKRVIRDVLKDFTFDEWHTECSHSTGASFTRPRKLGNPYYKWQGKLAVTPRALPYLQHYIHRNALAHANYASRWSDDEGETVSIKLFDVVAGSKLDTVPKNAKTDRTICIEPEGNMLLQKGLGNMFRRRLAACGIDLNDQSYNQHLCRIGSRTGSLCTVDLSAASDSISLCLVEYLFSEFDSTRIWYDAMMAVRSDRTLIKGVGWVPLEKISSMGNGYTFELESLIFYALVKAILTLRTDCDDKRLAVYGDDIVCHNSVYDDIVSVFSACGFTVNREKSFVKGPFRESCGKHYFLGVDVTPVYWDHDEVSMAAWCHLLNSLRIKGSCYWFRNRTCYRALLSIARYAPRVPLQCGLTAGIICNLDESQLKWDRKRWAWRYKALVKQGFVFVRDDGKVSYVPRKGYKKVVNSFHPEGHPAYVVAMQKSAYNSNSPYAKSPFDEATGELTVNLDHDSPWTLRGSLTSSWCTAPLWPAS